MDLRSGVSLGLQELGRQPTLLGAALLEVPRRPPVLQRERVGTRATEALLIRAVVLFVC